jgi:hypothetical protein
LASSSGWIAQDDLSCSLVKMISVAFFSGCLRLGGGIVVDMRLFRYLCFGTREGAFSCSFIVAMNGFSRVDMPIWIAAEGQPA